MKNFAYPALLLSLIVHSTCFAARPTVATNPPVVEGSSDEFDTRSRFGMYGSLFADPGINLVGLNFIYRITDSWHVHAGVGTIIEATTIGAGVDYFIPVKSRFRPYLGTGLNVVVVDSYDLQFIDNNTYHYNGDTLCYLDLRVGINYEAPSGFFVGLRMLGGLALGKYSGFGVVPVPGLNIGSYF